MCGEIRTDCTREACSKQFNVMLWIKCLPVDDVLKLISNSNAHAVEHILLRRKQSETE